ncbi:MAG TPA: thioredoxin fold domain-containing protein [Planctomycetota bacterium]|jgi:TolA-binding protein|nr:thioredoxin fold domain-containing protein [Planctomycetota bacterium]
MDTVTYPHGGVQRRLGEHFVCVRPQIDVEKDLAKKYLATWTPGFFFVDGQENVHYRATGYHPPEMFEHLLDFARGLMAFNRGSYDEAGKILTAVAEDKDPSPLQAEACFWLGVARYKGGDKDALSKTWSSILDRHPNSLWAPKVGFIREKEKVAKGRRRTG